MFHVPNQYRIRRGPAVATTELAGNNGVFLLPPRHANRCLFCIVSDGVDWVKSGLPGKPWEHVSVHAGARNGRKVWTPTWDEIVHVKGLFWDAEDCVVQFHPPRSSYVNVHPHVLHLWRPTNGQIPLPPVACV